MDSFYTQLTQLLHHCHQATDEEYRIAADSLIPLCLWLGAELMFIVLDEINEPKSREGVIKCREFVLNHESI
ncbi:MAG: hypothetical protein Fur006_60370 [Coleofasciculaceae cyanobacterium]